MEQRQKPLLPTPPDQKEKKEWDVASGKEAKRLTSFLLLFS